MPNTDNLRFDVRLLRRNLRDNIISEEEYETHLKSLDDLEGKYEMVEIAEEPAEEPTDEDTQLNG